MKPNDITILIFTRNEEKHITRCIQSLLDLEGRIVLVDGFSTDCTKSIAENFGAEVIQKKTEGKVFNFGKEINWALDNISIESEWVLKIDADEFLSPQLCREIKSRLTQWPSEIVGAYLKRRVYFMDRWIRWGDYYPVYEPRIWRNGKARYEEKFADEQLIFAPGQTIVMENDFHEKHLMYLTEWTSKHNSYSVREAIDFLISKHKLIQDVDSTNKTGSRVKTRRWLKNNVYYRTPYFVRPLLYFTYRYFVKLGFLDGKEGLIWHFLQGCWYRFLVDAKIYQVEVTAKKEKISIQEAIKKIFEFDISEIN